ncbi:hypothetical protein BC830DRAFT_1128255 [Chytriomyces sp. MP71]|nr:hypothetical protein BC830DRAFT_1128255 [Chytriomyces sp. MP71]
MSSISTDSGEVSAFISGTQACAMLCHAVYLVLFRFFVVDLSPTDKERIMSGVFTFIGLSLSLKVTQLVINYFKNNRRIKEQVSPPWNLEVPNHFAAFVTGLQSAAVGEFAILFGILHWSGDISAGNRLQLVLAMCGVIALTQGVRNLAKYVTFPQATKKQE